MASRDINQLIEPFRTSVKTLLVRAEKYNIPAFITETTRTLEEQKANVAKGVSWTLNSKHLTGEAVDIAFTVNGKLSYSADLYKRLYEVAKGIPYIIWPYKDLGWNVDKPHFQYDKNKIIGDNIDMTEVERAQLESEIRKLNTEIGTVTSERDKLNSQVTEEVKQKNEYYSNWQKELDLRKGLEGKVNSLTDSENKLSKIIDIIGG